MAPGWPGKLVVHAALLCATGAADVLGKVCPLSCEAATGVLQGRHVVLGGVEIWLHKKRDEAGVDKQPYPKCGCGAYYQLASFLMV